MEKDCKNVLHIIYVMTLFDVQLLDLVQSINNDEKQSIVFEIDGLTELIDLGHSFNEDDYLNYQLGKTPFNNYNYNRQTRMSFDSLVFNQDGTTRLDSPHHFNESGWKITEIPLKNLLVPGFLLDVTNETEKNNEFELKPEHLINWERINGKIPDNSVLLINFGWASRWLDKDIYLGLNYGDNVCRFPGISKEAANWIVDNRKIIGVGVDTASVDVGTSSDFAAHRILSSANVYNIENINFQTGMNLPPRDFHLIIMPMKITDADVAPCRIIMKPIESITSRRKCNIKRGTSNNNEEFTPSSAISLIRINLVVLSFLLFTV